MITRQYRDINTNSFLADIILNANYTDGISVLEFTAIITSGNVDLNTVNKSSLHPEANMMNIVIIPTSKNMEDITPLELLFCGTWDNLLASIKTKLVELNRLPDMLAGNLAFKVDNEKTKFRQIVKSLRPRLEFTQLISETDLDFARTEDVMRTVKDIQNQKNMDIFGKYILDIMID